MVVRPGHTASAAPRGCRPVRHERRWTAPASRPRSSEDARRKAQGPRPKAQGARTQGRKDARTQGRGDAGTRGHGDRRREARRRGDRRREPRGASRGDWGNATTARMGRRAAEGRAVRLSMRRFQVWRLPPFGWRAPTRPACGVPRLVHDAPLGSLASDSREPLPGSKGGRLNPRSGAFFAWPAADAARQVAVVRGAAASHTHCVARGRLALASGSSRSSGSQFLCVQHRCAARLPKPRPAACRWACARRERASRSRLSRNDRPRPRRTLGMPRRAPLATPRVRLPCTPHVREHVSDRVR